jgi:uncharacterized protein (TIGR02996 family)
MDVSLLQAIQAEPRDRSGWLILSDWLEEEGRPDEAEFVRLRESLTQDVRSGAERDAREARLRELLRAKVPPPAAVWTGKLTRKVPISFSLIPPGRFLMGSLNDEPDRYDNEGPPHPVTITRPFYLGVYPVTQAQWSALMGDEPFSFRGPDRPADSISAHEAENFCRRASEALGREVRLPYEAEWEHACRGGTRTMFYTGNGDRAMRKAGWCSREATGTARWTKRVGLYLPNPWGLYDMSGNVREWCADDQRQFTREAQTDPRGPASNVSRIVRGGSWYYTAEDSRSASRYQRPMDYRLEYYGFRVAMPCG